MEHAPSRTAALNELRQPMPEVPVSRCQFPVMYNCKGTQVEAFRTCRITRVSNKTNAFSAPMSIKSVLRYIDSLFLSLARSSGSCTADQTFPQNALIRVQLRGIRTPSNLSMKTCRSDLHLLIVWSMELMMLWAGAVRRG